MRRGTVKAHERAEIVVVDVSETDEEPVMPEPMRPLGKNGKQLFDYVWAHAPWLTRADLPSVQTLAELEDERAVYRQKAIADPAKNWRQSIAARNTERNQFVLSSQLGLSPSSRASMGLAISRTAQALESTNRLMRRKSDSGYKTFAEKHSGPAPTISGAGR